MKTVILVAALSVAVGVSHGNAQTIEGDVSLSIG